MFLVLHLKFEKLDCVAGFLASIFFACLLTQQLCKKMILSCWYSVRSFSCLLVQPKYQRCQGCSRPNLSSHLCYLVSLCDRFQYKTTLSKFYRYHSLELSGHIWGWYEGGNLIWLSHFKLQVLLPGVAAHTVASLCQLLYGATVLISRWPILT